MNKFSAGALSIASSWKIISDPEKEKASRYCRAGGGAVQRLEGVTCGQGSKHTSRWGYQEKERAQKTTERDRAR